MTDSIKNYIDDIHTAMADISGDPTRASDSYYIYGDKFFDTNEGVPPQVRYTKLDWSIGGPQKTQSISNLSGSIGTFQQNIQCSIWGSDVDGCLTELQLFCKAIQRVKNPISNSTGLAQQPIVGVNGTWADTSAQQTLGERLFFNFPININIPQQPAGYVLIVSAAIEVSNSVPNTSLNTVSGSISASYAEGIGFTVTSASYA